MSKIYVVGDEDFTLGFELVGIESKKLDDLEVLFSKDSNAGIVIITQEDYHSLSVKTKSQIDRMIKPIVIILSKDDIKGGNLREAVVKALGVDILK